MVLRFDNPWLTRNEAVTPGELQIHAGDGKQKFQFIVPYPLARCHLKVAPLEQAPAALSRWTQTLRLACENAYARSDRIRTRIVVTELDLRMGEQGLGLVA